MVSGATTGVGAAAGSTIVVVVAGASTASNASYSSAFASDHTNNPVRPATGISATRISEQQRRPGIPDRRGDQVDAHGRYRRPSSAGVGPLGYVANTSASAFQTGRYSLWSEIVGPLSTSAYSTAPPPSTVT